MGGFFYIPGSVKLCEPPGKAGGLPIVIITDSYHLSLPGLSAGEISVFRVAAVDTESIEIPHNRAGVITPLES